MQASLPDVKIRLQVASRWTLLPWLLFLGTCAVMLAIRGVHHGGDTPRFLDGAERLFAGEPLVGRQGAYVGYLIVVGVDQTTGAGGAGIIAFQVLISALCMAAIHDLGRRIGGELAGIAAAVFYAANLDLARFTFAILTDSLYTSGLVLSAHTSYRYAATSDRRWLGAATVIVLGTAALRPGGAFVVPVFGTWLTFTVLRNRASLWKWAVSLGVAVGLLTFFVTPIAAVFATEDPMQWILEGTVIYEHEPSRLEMPPSEVSEPSALAYCSSWPVSCARLFAHRLALYFGHARSFYSLRHNVVIALVFPPLYLLAIVGFWRARFHPFTVPCLALVGLHSAVAALTFADWDGRFLLFIFPLITLYSGVGFAVLATRLTAGPERVPAPAA